MEYLGSTVNPMDMVNMEYVDEHSGGGGGTVIPSRALTALVHTDSGTGVDRLTNYGYVGVRFPTMGLCFLAVSATINFAKSATTAAQIVVDLSDDDKQYAPSIAYAGSVQCVKDVDIMITSSGTISIIPNEAIAVGDTIRFTLWWRIAASVDSGAIGYTDLDEYVQGMLDSISGKQAAFTVGDGLSMVNNVLSLDLDNYDGGAF